MPWGKIPGAGGGEPLPTNPDFDSMRVGDIAGGNYTQVGTDGVLQTFGASTLWDEIASPAIGRNIDTSTGRIDFNYDELTVDFASNARYPDEPIANIIQSLHSRVEGSDIRPHIHWMQNQSAQPNILVEYRFINNGESPTAWTPLVLDSGKNIYVYPGSGTILQITEFNLPPGHGSTLGLSGTFEYRMFRDTSNASGLFSGSDTYSGDWSVKYLDTHLEIDQDGSREEFTK